MSTLPFSLVFISSSDGKGITEKYVFAVLSRCFIEEGEGGEEEEEEREENKLNQRF
jgi:hypothetical protein